MSMYIYIIFVQRIILFVLSTEDQWTVENAPSEVEVKREDLFI